MKTCGLSKRLFDHVNVLALRLIGGIAAGYRSSTAGLSTAGVEVILHLCIQFLLSLLGASITATPFGPASLGPAPFSSSSTISSSTSAVAARTRSSANFSSSVGQGTARPAALSARPIPIYTPASTLVSPITPRRKRPRSSTGGRDTFRKRPTEDDGRVEWVTPRAAGQQGQADGLACEVF